MTMTALQQILAGKNKSAPVASPATAPATSPVAATKTATGSVASATPSPTFIGPNAADVATPQGTPPDTLAALLADFTANAGKMPQVNPPEAPKVLAGPTTLEVAGNPETEEQAEEKVEPVEKPAEVLAAEQAKKSRRTAAAVQVELDAALKRIDDLEDKLANAETRLQDAGAGATDDANAGALAEAVELIQSLQAEAKVSAEDNAKAWARVAEVEAERDEALAQNAANVEVFKEKLAKQVKAPTAPVAVSGDLTFGELADALVAQLPIGASVTLTGQR
jgi:hypothetical protein